MKHVIPLIIKFVMISLVLVIIFSFSTSLTITQILSISLTVTILAYIIGDLIILDRFNNTVATVADMGLVLIAILMYEEIFLNTDISFMDAAIAALIIGGGEWFFHKYVTKAVYSTKAK